MVVAATLSNQASTTLTKCRSTSSLTNEHSLDDLPRDLSKQHKQFNSLLVNLNSDEDEITKEITRLESTTTESEAVSYSTFNSSPSPSSASSTSAANPVIKCDLVLKRVNSISSGDDLDDLIIRKDIQNIDEHVLTDDEDLSEEEDDKNKTKSNEEDEEEGDEPTPVINLKPIQCISSSNSLACEVASLSSLTSNYSQFDFLNTRRKSPSPPPITSAMPPPPPKTSNSLTSFFFSPFNKNKSLNVPNSTNNCSSSSSSSSSSTLDIITSKLLNLKTNSKVDHTKISSSSTSTVLSHQAASGDNHSIKSNHSSGYNISSLSSLEVPNSVLIFENRPSNLPAKSQQESLKHKLEYEKMIEAAKKKEIKEKELRLKKHAQQLKKEDFLANSLRIWNNEILKNWTELRHAKRTQQLWWHGLPPSIRGKVWLLAIGNQLNLAKEAYVFYEKKAREKLEQLSQTPEDTTTINSVELIKLDVSRTFPQLCFFQRDGPLHESLHSVLGAYACYNPRIGYVQGMSFLTAILLLNMDAPDAFVCLANLLNTSYLSACFCMNQTRMNRYFRVHEILFEHNIPKLYRHFVEQKVKPDLYLIEWIFTLFSKSLNIETTSRVWDIFFRDQEEFLFRAALGILNMYKDTLVQMDFIHIVQFLTKLPENINTTQLFKSIEQISTSIDDVYLTFKHLMDEVNSDSMPNCNPVP